MNPPDLGNAAAGPCIAPLPLAIAVAIVLVATVYPRLLIGAGGHVDDTAALALFCAMSAGFVRDVGFVALHPFPRWLLSGWACFAGVALALAHRLAG